MACATVVPSFFTVLCDAEIVFSAPRCRIQFGPEHDLLSVWLFHMLSHVRRGFFQILSLPSTIQKHIDVLSCTSLLCEYVHIDEFSCHSYRIIRKKPVDHLTSCTNIYLGFMMYIQYILESFLNVHTSSVTSNDFLCTFPPEAKACARFRSKTAKGRDVMTSPRSVVSRAPFLKR